MSDDMWEWDKEQCGGWEWKCWGRVRHVFESPEVGVSILKVDRGARCSRHYHIDRINDFKVISGIISIWQWDSEKDAREHPLIPSMRTVLLPGNVLSIPRGVPHMFHVIQSGIVVEVYSAAPGAEVSMSDIVRLDEGESDAKLP